MSALLTALRERTQNLHKETEAAMRIMDPQLSLEDYRATLHIFRRFYRALKIALDAQPPKISTNDFSVDAQLARLDADLQSIGDGSEDRTEITPLKIPEMKSEGSLMGVFYVVEGSALGGQLISRHLQQTLGLTPANGGAFFHGAGSDTGQKWKAFLGRLSDFEIRGEAHEDVLEAAEGTFRCLLNLIENPPIPTREGSTSRESQLRPR